jgi:lipid-A-disaccharide synthase
MKYYIIAGERSGDLHASNLIKELRNNDPQAEFRAWGGDMMKNQGAVIVKHIDELAFMGFVEVVRNLPAIMKNFRLCKNDILNYKPDAIIFIDYPGFNLRIAQFAKQNNIRTIYYISPQVWAWHKSRVKKIRRDIELMLVILPFEKDFYDKHNVQVSFVGHPLLDALHDYKKNISSSEFRKANQLSDKPLIALLPGSRQQEISRMLTVMDSVAGKFPDYQFVVAGISAHSQEFYQQFLKTQNVKLIFEQTYALLYNSDAALVASGTATLETALIGTPQIVCYKAGTLSYLIAKQLVDIKYISLVNLVMDKQIVRELIQYDFKVNPITAELSTLLFDLKKRNEMLQNYGLLKEKLGGVGASENAAKEIVKFLNQ